MKQVLLHLDNALNVLRQSDGTHAAIISTLEGVHARLMHDIFGLSSKRLLTLSTETERMDGIGASGVSELLITVTAPSEAPVYQDAGAPPSQSPAQIFRLDRLRRHLFRVEEGLGCEQKIKLRPKALSVLGILAERPEKLVTKDEIKTLWRGRVVEDGAIHAQ